MEEHGVVVPALLLWVCHYDPTCPGSLADPRLYLLRPATSSRWCFALGEGKGEEGKRASHLGESRFVARRRGENVENRNYRLPIAEKSKNENFGTQKHEICTAPRRDAQIRNSIGNFQSEMRPEARKSKGGIARASLEHRSSNHLGAVGPDHFGAPQ